MDTTQYIMNPLTNRLVKVNGKAHKQMLKKQKLNPEIITPGGLRTIPEQRPLSMEKSSVIPPDPATSGSTLQGRPQLQKQKQYIDSMGHDEDEWSDEENQDMDYPEEHKYEYEYEQEEYDSEEDDATMQPVAKRYKSKGGQKRSPQYEHEQETVDQLMNDHGRALTMAYEKYGHSDKFVEFLNTLM